MLTWKTGVGGPGSRTRVSPTCQWELEGPSLLREAALPPRPIGVRGAASSVLPASPNPRPGQGLHVRGGRAGGLGLMTHLVPLLSGDVQVPLAADGGLIEAS